MPAVSKAQQRFFGMVRATQKGEMKNPSSEILDVADDISVKDAKKMAKTKHKGLPEKVKEELVSERLGGKGYKSYTSLTGKKVSGDWEDSDRGAGNKAKRRAGGKVKKKSPTYLAHVHNKEEVELSEISKKLAVKADYLRKKREFDAAEDRNEKQMDKQLTKSGKFKSDENRKRILKKHGDGAKEDLGKNTYKVHFEEDDYSTRDSELKKTKKPRDQRYKTLHKATNDVGNVDVNEDLDYRTFIKNAEDARAKVKKRTDERKKKDAAYVDRVKKGIRFYDKKGKGHIRGGKKVYD